MGFLPLEHLLSGVRARCWAAAGSLGPPGVKTPLEVRQPIWCIDTVNGKDYKGVWLFYC